MNNGVTRAWKRTGITERCRGCGATLFETVLVEETQQKALLDEDGRYHFGPGGCADVENWNGWQDDIQFGDPPLIQ